MPVFVASFCFFVFVAPLSPPDLSLSCTSRVGRHSVALPRCAPRFCGFCQCPMRPDCCAPRSRPPGVVYPIFQALLLRCSACFSDVLALRRLPISLLRFAPPVVASLFFVTDLFLGPARVPGCCCSGVFLLRFVQASCGSVALSCLADYFVVAVYNRPVALVPMSFRFRVPGRGVPVSVSSFCLPSSVAPLSSRRIAGCFFCSPPLWLFPPVCVAPLVLPVCFSVSFSRLRYPVSLFSSRPGSCRSLRLPDSAFPVFAITHLFQ